MFSRIEKPHYSIVGDYVVFSNDIPSLQLLIDAYLDQNTLEYSREYDDFAGHFETRSNIFTYLNNQYFYNYLRSNLDYEHKVSIHKNRDYLFAFPRIGFQLYPGDGMYKTFIRAEFKPEDEKTANP